MSKIKSNSEITYSTVRLMDEFNEQIDILPLRDAQDIADEKGLDLILVTESAKPPVCKLGDLSKIKYNRQKKIKANKKRQQETRKEVKEIRLRPVTDKHDMETKAKNTLKFLAKGSQVKITMKFRGREIANKEQGFTSFESFLGLLGEVTFIKRPSFEGRNLTSIIEK